MYEKHRQVQCRFRFAKMEIAGALTANLFDPDSSNTCSFKGCSASLEKPFLGRKKETTTKLSFAYMLGCSIDDAFWHC